MQAIYSLYVLRTLILGFGLLSCAMPAFTQSCGTPTNLRTHNVNATHVAFSWDSVPGAAGYVFMYRRQGAFFWTQRSTQANFTTLTNLKPEQRYEASVTAFCPNNTHSTSAPVRFRLLPDTCPPPLWHNITLQNKQRQVAKAVWKPIPNAEGYIVAYRPQGTQAWTAQRVRDTTAAQVEIYSGEKVELRVRTVCRDMHSAWTPIVNYQLPARFSISVYPNPNKGMFELTLDVNRSNIVNFKLINLMGVTLKEWDFAYTAGYNRYSFNLEDIKIARGIYTMRAKSPDFEYHTKILIDY